MEGLSKEINSRQKEHVQTKLIKHDNIRKDICKIHYNVAYLYQVKYIPSGVTQTSANTDIETKLQHSKNAFKQ